MNLHQLKSANSLSARHAKLSEQLAAFTAADDYRVTAGLHSVNLDDPVIHDLITSHLARELAKIVLEARAIGLEL